MRISIDTSRLYGLLRRLTPPRNDVFMLFNTYRIKIVEYYGHELTKQYNKLHGLPCSRMFARNDACAYSRLLAIMVNEKNKQYCKKNEHSY